VASCESHQLRFGSYEHETPQGKPVVSTNDFKFTILPYLLFLGTLLKRWAGNLRAKSSEHDGNRTLTSAKLED
jgi:hypothetical protein